MAFVADDLGAWLIGLLADAGRKKVTALLLGSERERALRRVATAAIESTARELAPAGSDQGEHLAMVVGEVFRQPGPGPVLAGQATLLETLRSGISESLAVLDDPGLTGTGHSSAQLLGVSGGVLPVGQYMLCSLRPPGSGCWCSTTHRIGRRSRASCPGGQRARAAHQPESAPRFIRWVAGGCGRSLLKRRQRVNDQLNNQPPGSGANGPNGGNPMDAVSCVNF